MFEVMISQEPANINDCEEGFDLFDECNDFLDDLLVALYATAQVLELAQEELRRRTPGTPEYRM